jgi:recombination protein RecT
MATKEKTLNIPAETGDISQQFLSLVWDNFTVTATEALSLTQSQRRLANNYRIALDQALDLAETKRLSKPEKYRETLSYTWQNINLQKLAIDVVALCRLGLDPLQKNHVSLIPFKNKRTNKYDIGFIEGYRGLEIKVEKYGLDVPDSVIVKIVHQNDKFEAIERDKNNPKDDYIFKIENPWDRGPIVGGFYYLYYRDNPEKCKLKVFSKADIDKRKPDYASVEFWGGEKAVYENGKKTGKTEIVEGWYEEMAFKTIYRAAYNSITIDSIKIDENYNRMLAMEREVDFMTMEQQRQKNANKETIDIETGEVEQVDAQTEVSLPEEKSAQPFSPAPSNSKAVKDLIKYIEMSQNREAAYDQVQKEYFHKLTKDERKEIIDAYVVLIGETSASNEFQQEQGFNCL